MKPIVNSLHFGSVPVGGDAPPVLLPDIDMFFNRDLELAEHVVRTLVDAGVNVLKGAVIHRADIALDDGTLEEYYDPKVGMVSENYRALMERKVMTFDEHESLFRLCQGLGPELVLSVYDTEGAQFAKDVGACALKIPSSNITHEPLIRDVAGIGLPVIIDTGKSNMEEISRAVQWFRDADGRELLIEHSPEAPPAPLANHNLRMMLALQHAFDVPVGLSCHHAGNEMMYAAVALGASIIEKGVCADDAPIDQDVHHAIRVGDVGDMWRKCLNIHHALGEPGRYLRRDRDKPKARMGLVAKRSVVAGEKVGPETVDFAFPSAGISTEHWSTVEGWDFKFDLTAGQVINWHDLDTTA
ncbi:MAG: N-acetylneuraminate synthase family protein [Pseudomonadota bacterium]